MLTDAAEQLRRVGTPLLGAVVLPRLSGLRPTEIEPPAVALTALPTENNSPMNSGPSPDETAVLDAEKTMRFPTSRPAPRKSSEEPPTAVIELTPARKEDE
jgi:hypothetical protein